MAFVPSPRLQARILSFMASLRRPRADSAGIQRAVLYAVYGNDIIVRLARIHAHAGRDGRDGTLVVALHGRTPAYVRCAFTPDGGTLSCEAVTGTYPPKPGTPPSPVPVAMQAALKEAGYWRDEATGRFLFPFEIGKEPDRGVWGGAAVTILKPLIDVFGACPGSKIEVLAPLAPERDEAAIRRELANE